MITPQDHIEETAGRVAGLLGPSSMPPSPRGRNTTPPLRPITTVKGGDHVQGPQMPDRSASAQCRIAFTSVDPASGQPVRDQTRRLARRGGRKYRAWMVQQPAPKAAPHETNQEPTLDSTPSRPDPLYWSGEFAPAWNDRQCDAGILRQQSDHLRARE